MARSLEERLRDMRQAAIDDDTGSRGGGGQSAVCQAWVEPERVIRAAIPVDFPESAFRLAFGIQLWG